MTAVTRTVTVREVEGELVRVGISAFAVDQLGDIVFVELPEVGDSLSQGSTSVQWGGEGGRGHALPD